MNERPTELRVDVAAEVKACRETAREVREFFGLWLADRQLLDDLELIVTEGLANVAKHASGNGTEHGRAEVRVRMFPGQHVELTLTDNGPGMDESLLDKPLPPPESASGRGLFLINALADNATIRCGQGRCELTVVKNVEEKAWR